MGLKEMRRKMLVSQNFNKSKDVEISVLSRDSNSFYPSGKRLEQTGRFRYDPAFWKKNCVKQDSPRGVSRILIWAFFLVFFVSGCNLGWKRYVDKEYRFSILIPRSWKEEKGLYNTTLLVRAPLEEEKDRFSENINIVVTELPKEISLSTFFELNKNELMSKLSGIKEFSEGNIFSGLLPGKYLSFEAKMKDLELLVTVCVWIKGKRVYGLTLTSETKEAKKYEPMFKRIIQSMRIR